MSSAEAECVIICLNSHVLCCALQPGDAAPCSMLRAASIMQPNVQQAIDAVSMQEATRSVASCHCCGSRSSSASLRWNAIGERRSQRRSWPVRVQPACCLLHVVRCVLHAMCCTLRLLLVDIAASCIALPAVLCVVAPRGLAMAYVSCMADDCMPRAVWCSCRSRRCGSTSCCRTSASLSGR
jgi:hypothetical protein